MPYTRLQLLDRFGPACLKRANACRDAVTVLHFGRDGLRAHVRGTQAELYEVEVVFEACDDAWDIDGRCGCPMRGNCEHVVAALLEGLTFRPRTVDADDAREVTASVKRAPRSRSQAPIDIVDAAPVPVLTLDARPVVNVRQRRAARHVRHMACGRFSFDYAGVTVGPFGHGTLFTAANGALVRIKRRADIERRSIDALLGAGMAPLSDHAASAEHAGAQAWHFADPAEWTGFVLDVVPRLRHGGWRIHIGSDFPFNVTRIDDLIDGSVRRGADGWFDLEMRVRLGERDVQLEPLLVELFRRDRRWLDGHLETIPDDEPLTLRIGQGERLLLGAARLKRLVRSLIDLLAAFGKEGTRARLRVDPRDLGRIARLSGAEGWRFPDGASFREHPDGRKAFSETAFPSSPVGLTVALRAYQHEGLAWLQGLRLHGLGGVLADDMGLGKTVQTLAHLLTEKAAGRLDRPVLIVVPTTLVRNWRDEARRFAPGLSVLDLLGPLRRHRFALIGAHDVVITTYALLWRDHAVLSRHDYHFLILDEAQYIKNVTSRAAGAIRLLRARHRLCLTGTPIENHLGELWSLFDFLMPGFLGTAREFKRHWRKPIEQDGDAARLALLRCRIAPFLLRRHKEDVARELPAKTVIVRAVALEGAQRDFYETVRVAVRAKVRAALAEQGGTRGHIAVLDALLKLRQVCCDPRLVKFDGAVPHRASAKLDHLMTMLPSLVAAGHRILLFSQFTEMLALIAASLDDADLRYVVLTGATVDRSAPIERFQRGEVPLFLVSLKAGGVGLNLTAADTVIHYDPWWNPASEAQATDRAHRLGQDRPVFVYKLIAAGTVEEKIVALQERKAALAMRLLADAGASSRFSPEELAALLDAIQDTPDAPAKADVPL